MAVSACALLELKEAGLAVTIALLHFTLMLPGCEVVRSGASSQMHSFLSLKEGGKKPTKLPVRLGSTGASRVGRKTSQRGGTAVCASTSAADVC